MSRIKLPRIIFRNRSNGGANTVPQNAIAHNDIACICVQQGQFWYCMKRLPDGSLEQCDGPFESLEECSEHNCIV